MVTPEVVRQRLDDGTRTTELEAAELLRGLLKEAAAAEGDRARSVAAAGVLALSALDLMDHSEDSTEIMVDELRSNAKRAESLNELLRRLVDRSAPDRITSPEEALSVLEQVDADLRATAEPPASVARAREAAKESASGTNRTRTLAKLGLAAVGVLLVALLAYEVLDENREATSPSFDVRVPGTTVHRWTPEDLAEQRMAVEWADEGYRASSRDNQLDGATSWPDVFPEHLLNSGQAWYARYADEGLEWASFRWNTKVRARSVIIVECFNPGALIAVDDLVDAQENTIGAGRIERLWTGELEPLGEARVVELRLAEPRWIGGVRIMLDTARVAGFNAIDAVGLLPD